MVLATGVVALLSLVVQIYDITPAAAPYKVDDTKASVMLQLTIGNSKPRQFGFDRVSNQAPSETEMRIWRENVTEKMKCSLPTAAWCRQRAEDMVSVRRNYRYKMQDVVALATKRSQDVAKVTSLSVKKSQLELRINFARDRIREMRDKGEEVDEELERRYVCPAGLSVFCFGGVAPGADCSKRVDGVVSWVWSVCGRCGAWCVSTARWKRI